MITWKELQTKTPEELRELLGTWKEELRGLRFSVAQKQLKQVRAVRMLRRRIAQVLTLINKQ